ncbi:MAG: hypothetical protein PHX04_01495 [Bacilli bacterium]|nr:hypothetical protein [Bacilli bacterium]
MRDPINNKKKENIEKTNNNISFYDENFSILIDNINFFTIAI